MPNAYEYDEYGHPACVIDKGLEETIKRLFNMGYSIDGVYRRVRGMGGACRYIKIDDVAKLKPKGKLRLPPEFEEKVYIRWQELKYTRNIQKVLEYLQAEGHVMITLDDIKHLCVKNLQSLKRLVEINRKTDESKEGQGS